MSKKNKNTNVNTDAVVDEVNTEATEVAETVEEFPVSSCSFLLC